MESGDIKFESKGVKARFINISDKYAQGGNVPVHIVEEGVSFDEDMYSGILSDFDMDGLPNADDPNPFEGQDAASVEQMKFSKTFKNILETKQELNDDLNEFIGKLKTNAPSQSKIYGRTKTPFSILNKLVSTRLLDEKKGLKDLVGTTVTFEDYEDLEDFKNKAKRGLYGKVVDYDDYYANPKDGYRAYHFIIEQNGVPIELQLKTDRMKDINVLSHDAYKNKTLNKDYMLYLTTLAEHADKGNKTAQNEFAQLMSKKSQVEKQLNN
jgi:(p)ppGpp synthase/HD superfamily hydrolase